MNFATTVSVDTEAEDQQQIHETSAIYHQGNDANYKKDQLFQKKQSLKILNHSNVALPVMKNRNNMGKKSNKLRPVGSLKKDIMNNSEQKLVLNKDESRIFLKNHNDSSIMTANGSAATIADGDRTITQQNYSIAMEEHSKMTGQSSTILQNQNGKGVGEQRKQGSVRHSQKSFYSSTDDAGAGFGSLAFQRNSSTVDKTRRTLYNKNNIKETFRRNAKNSNSVMETTTNRRPIGIIGDSHQKDFVTSVTLNQSKFSGGLHQQQSQNNIANWLAPEYSSVKVLPVIGQETHVLEQSNEKSSMHRASSRVELTRKEVQNFLVNGQVSKEFIHSNKKEIQKFIRNQARSSVDNGLMGYEVYTKPLKTTGTTLQASQPYENKMTLGSSIEGNSTYSNLRSSARTIAPVNDLALEDEDNKITPNVQRKLVGQATIHVDNQLKQRLASQQKLRSEVLISNEQQMVFPNDVRLEKKFKGDKAVVSSRALETWINETLTDAYHLEIPGVLTKPQHKNPVHRYGIDRQTLVNAGVSSEEVDRIYRSLFVYSVGFFELLKKILASTSKNFQIITTIWKVFQVLLEYCCKTDYRILISEVTEQHHREMNTIELNFKEKIQEHFRTEKILNQNLETLTEYNDMLEKDRAKEKQLRLKLEEEYMQNTKNHEEEVKLRLKFEGKFNTMHDTHRELEIRHDRTLVELRMAQQQLKESEDEAKVKSTELVTIQKVRVEQDSLIATLKEYKLVTEKEIKKKNLILRTADTKRTQAQDNYELKRYEVQESAKDLNDVKTKMDVQTQEIEHLRGILAANQLEKDEIESARQKIKTKYKKIKAQFEERAGQIELYQADSEAKTQTVKEYITELEPLRKQNESLENKLNDINEKFVESFEKRKQLKDENKRLDNSLYQTQDQVKKLNEGRHKVLKQLAEMTESADNYAKQIENQKKTLELNEAEFERNANTFEKFKDSANKKEAYLSDTIDNYKTKLEEMTENNKILDEQLESMTKSFDGLTLQFEDKTLKGEELKNIVSSQVVKITQLTGKSDELRRQVESRRVELQITQTRIRQAELSRDEALIDKLTAEEIASTYKETVAGLRRQMRDEKENIDQKQMAIFLESQLCNERDMMHAEEIVSQFGEMHINLSAALKEQEENRQMIEDYHHLKKVLVVVETERDQTLKEINNQKNKVNDLEATITDKNAEIGVIKDSHAKQLQQNLKDHNMEVNGLEQKIQQHKIDLMQQKKQALTQVREDKRTVEDLKRQVKKAEQAAKQNKGKTSSPTKAKDMARVTRGVDKGTQTNATKRLSQMVQTSEKLVSLKASMKQSAEFEVGEVGNDGVNEAYSSSIRISKDMDRQASASSISLPSNSEDQQTKSRNEEKNENSSEKDKMVSPDDDDDDEDEDEESNQVAHFQENIEIDQLDAGGLVDLENNEQKEQLAQRAQKIQKAQEEAKAKVNERLEQYKKWLIAEERVILVRMEQAIENGDRLHPNQIKVWRSEMRVPAMFLDLKLTDSELDQVEQLQLEQAEEFKARALRKMEEGSQYSSDYEEVELSDYVSTEGEGQPTQEEYQVSNIKVMRGATLKPERTSSARPSASQQKQNSEQQSQLKASGGFSGQNDMNKTDNSFTPGFKAEDENSNQNDVQRNKTLDVTRLSLHSNIIKSDKDSSQMRLSAGDKVMEHLRQASARQNKKSQKPVDEEVHYSHEIDEQIPVTQYLIKHDGGKFVYKRRVVKKERVKKKRAEEYVEKKERALSARQKNMVDQEFNTREAIEKTYDNMYTKFAQNYSKTLKTLVKQSQMFLLNKAKLRRNVSKNDSVDNIQGRERHQFLIQQMKETPVWQLHLGKLKEELDQQEVRYQNRDEMKEELQKRREEIKQLEEQAERQKSQERRQKTQIIREDLEQQHMKATRQEKTSSLIAAPGSKQIEQQQTAVGETYGSAQGIEQTPLGERIPYHQSGISSANTIQVLDGSISLSIENAQTVQFQSKDTLHQEEAVVGVNQQSSQFADAQHINHQSSIEMQEQMSVWSSEETAGGHMLSQHDAQNPQGEEEEIKESQLILELQQSQVQRQTRGGSVLDPELQALNKGGVAAINRQQIAQRAQVQSQVMERQVDAVTRANKKDSVLMQSGMVPQQRQEEQKKKPAKLGPSSIRTLIRAADSRKD